MRWRRAEGCPAESGTPGGVKCAPAGGVPPRERRPSSEARAARAPGKAAMAGRGPVPETDTGRRGEEPQAGGRSIVKELGKMAP